MMNNGADLLIHMTDTACLRAAKDEGWKPIHQHLVRLSESAEQQGRKKMEGKTQNDMILDHISKTGSISQREALMDYSIQSLTKRISELRDMGFNIVREFHKHPTTGQRYVRYKLVG